MLPICLEEKLSIRTKVIFLPMLSFHVNNIRSSPNFKSIISRWQECINFVCDSQSMIQNDASRQSRASRLLFHSHLNSWSWNQNQLTATPNAYDIKQLLNRWPETRKWWPTIGTLKTTRGCPETTTITK